MLLRRLVIGGLAAVLLWPVSSASAATATRYADWTPLVGTSTDFTTTMQLSPRFPAATVTSDSRGGQVGVQSGASTWFGDTTPVGQRYGSSRNQPYLNLRPKADNASSPSTTTYTFERATPLGWTFVLGDIDADQVTISATLADGTPADAGDLGFQSSFNLCGYTPRPSSCGSPAPTDTPTWDPASMTLTGNAAAADTTGATGWFEPTAALRTLTFEFTRRAGFPIYQTWFALRTQDVTGTVDVSQGTCDVSGVRVELLGLLGNVIVSTTPDESGAYAFTGLAASPNYRIGISNLPDDCLVVGPSSQTFDLSDGDTVVPFEVRQIVGAPISGTVSVPGGGPVEGVTVTLRPTDAAGAPVTTTTDVDGFYVFDGNVAGVYVVTISPPDGYSRGSGDRQPTIPAGSEEAVPGQDFTLVANPTISGTVRTAEAADPLAGVTVELRDEGGTVIERAVTAADGSYAFVRVPGSSTYMVAVPNPPSTYGVPPVQTFEVDTSDSSDHDFALSRPGSLSGTVIDASGDPVAGVTLRLTGPDGLEQTLTTDAAGSYDTSGLQPGSYTVSVVAPDGTVVVGSASLTATITAAGESVGGLNFALSADDGEVTPTPTPSTGSGSGSSASGAMGVLPDTGAPSAIPAGIGVLLIAGGAACVLASRSRSTRSRGV